MASNRKTTKEQFSEGTTIDGSAIDKAIDDIVDTHNNIPAGFTDGRWMPVNYVSHWSPARSHWRSQSEGAGIAPLNNRARIGPHINACAYEHYFPFLGVRNWQDEEYPVAIATANNNQYDNDYRHKGFTINTVDLANEEWTRSTTTGLPEFKDPSTAGAGDIDNANGLFSYNEMLLGASGGEDITSYPQNNKMMAVTFSYYFNKPVILSSLNVVANQEHPISYYSSADNITADPANRYADIDTVTPKDSKRNTFQPREYDNPTFRGKDNTKFIESVDDSDSNIAETGAEFCGINCNAIGLGIPNVSVQVSVDNEFNKEKRELNNVVIQIREIQEAYDFNRLHTTNNRDAAHGFTGGPYTDMEPAYPGGSTWGLWITEKDLNVPIPRDSRVRFTVLVRGFVATQSFEWNCNLTVLEEVEE